MQSHPFSIESQNLLYFNNSSSVIDIDECICSLGLNFLGINLLKQTNDINSSIKELESDKKQTIGILNYHQLIDETLVIIENHDKLIPSNLKRSILFVLFVDKQNLDDCHIKLSEKLFNNKNFNVNNRLKKKEYQSISNPIYIFKDNKTSILIEIFINNEDFKEKNKRIFYVI